ncbi:MAG: hypothetical protein ACRDNP_01715 [Gaiellaceae bacterium]
MRPELRFAYEQIEQMGERGVRSAVFGLLADALLAQGRDDAAIEFAQTAAELAEQEGVTAQALQLTVRSRLSLHAGEVAEAECLAREAVELAETTDYLDLQSMDSQV